MMFPVDQILLIVISTQLFVLIGLTIAQLVVSAHRSDKPATKVIYRERRQKQQVKQEPKRNIRKML